jgi:hypothetical protein
VSFAAITLCVTSQLVFIIVVLFRYRLTPETFGYTLVHPPHTSHLEREELQLLLYFPDFEWNSCLYLLSFSVLPAPLLR